MEHLHRVAIVSASVALGATLGWFALAPLLALLMRHLPWFADRGGSNLAGAFLDLMMVGMRMGLPLGVGMTLAVLGGLLAGLALARRLGTPPRPPHHGAA